MNDDLICYPHPGASYRLVLLHGWGADAGDLLPMGKILSEANGEKFELVALQAPEPHPEGIGRQWYDLYPPNWQAVPSSVNQLQMRLKALDTDKIPLEKTVMLGFSQGGAMALASGCDLPIAGLICCSGYPHPNWMPSEVRPPVALFHGEQDQVVPSSASETLFSLLEESGADVELFRFKGGHEIPNELIPKLLNIFKKWCVEEEKK